MKKWLVCILLFCSVSVSAELNVEAKGWIATLLDMQLTPTNQEICQEIRDISQEAFEHVKACNYDMSLHVIARGLAKHPHSFLLQTNLATVIGDYADCSTCPANEKEEMIQKSKEIFKKLFEETDGQLPNIAFYFTNEYCWRFSLHQEQYENGLRRVEYFEKLGQTEQLGRHGYYYQGVGAAHYAKHLWLEGNKSLAREYAKKALIAWAQYFSYVNTYYNAYVHYALALGILGEQQEMMRALQRSATLIHKDLDYIEFKEVIDFINLIAEVY